MIKFERDDGRYYYMRIERDMFNDMVLFVIRGGIRHNISKRVCVGSIQAIMAKINELSVRRLQRGYTLVYS